MTAFDEGYEEGRKCGKPGVLRDENGKTKEENPYPVGTQAYKDWARGWQCANDGW